MEMSETSLNPPLDIQALGFHVLGDVDKLNYGGVTAILPGPALTFHTVFAKILFAKPNFGIDSRNISALRY